MIENFIAACAIIMGLAAMGILAVSLSPSALRLGDWLNAKPARPCADEDFTVMRNLLMDMVENETSLIGLNEVPVPDRFHRVAVQKIRRKELVGEAITVLKRHPLPRRNKVKMRASFQ